MDMINTRGLNLNKFQESNYSTRARFALFSTPMPASMADIPFDRTDIEDIARNAALIMHSTLAIASTEANVTFTTISQESIGHYQEATTGLMNYRKLIDADLVHMGEAAAQDVWTTPYIVHSPFTENEYSKEYYTWWFMNFQNSYLIDTPAVDRYTFMTGLESAAGESNLLNIEFPEETTIESIHCILYNATHSSRIRVEVYNETSEQWEFWAGPAGRDGVADNGNSIQVEDDGTYCTELEISGSYKRWHLDLSSAPLTGKKIRFGSSVSGAYMGGLQFLTKTTPTVRTAQEETLLWGIMIDNNDKSPNFKGACCMFDVGGLNSDTLMQLVDNKMKFTTVSDKDIHSEFPIIDHMKIEMNTYPNVVE